MFGKLIRLSFFYKVSILFIMSSILIRSQQTVPIYFTDQVLTIDGILEEELWKNSTSFSNFKTVKPDYGVEASEKTIVFVSNDSKNLYFAFQCFDSEPENIKASLTKRDNIETDDWVTIEIDPFNNAQSNYLFRVNPLGIQEDGIINQNDSEDLSSDMIWESKGKIDEKGYTIEMTIPFESIRFEQSDNVILSFSVRRSISRKSEISSFPEFDPQKGPRLLQFQKLSISGISSRNVFELIPTTTFSMGKEQSSGNWIKSDQNNEFGLTGKIGLSSDLIIDATYNPDFSQVESDAGQVDINLRHALFYSEKRPFFLEGRENYSLGAMESDGWWLPIREVINTRNIVDPLAGIKLTGKLSSKDNLFALLAIDEYPRKYNDEIGGKKLSNSFFSIFRYKHLLAEDNYLGGLYTSNENTIKYNRVLGIDGRLRLSGKDRIEYHLLGSLSKNIDSENKNNGMAFGIEYYHDSRKLSLGTGIHHISQKFKTDIGYMTRNGLGVIPFYATYKLYFDNNIITNLIIRYTGQYIMDYASDLFETYNWLGGELALPLQTWIWFGGNYRTEIFLNKRFNRSYWGIGGSTQIMKELALYVRLENSMKVYYDYENPYQGSGKFASFYLVLQPTKDLSSTFGFTYSDFYRSSDDQKIYEFKILRNSTSFQFNKYLYLRGIVEYNYFYRRLHTDFVLSFTYVPGTVIHLGYGSEYEKVRWDKQQYVNSNNFLETKRGLFLKVSYLWRE